MRKQAVVLYNMFYAYPSCEIHYTKKEKKTDRNRSIIGCQQSQSICQKNWKKCIIRCSCKLSPRDADRFALLASRGQKEGWFFTVKLLYLQLEKEKERVSMQSYYL